MVMAEFKFQLTNQNVKFPLYQYYGIYTEVFSVNTMFWMWTKYQTKRRENYCSSQLDVHMFLDLYMYHLYSLTLFLARRVPPVEQELLSLPEYLSLPPFFLEFVLPNL